MRLGRCLYAVPIALYFYYLLLSLSSPARSHLKRASSADAITAECPVGARCREALPTYTRISNKDFSSSTVSIWRYLTQELHLA